METFNRVELKFLLDTKTYNNFLNDLRSYVELDKHCPNETSYKINNVYYDNDDGYLARSSMLKSKNYKFKIRFRFYEDLFENGFLEIKEKNNGIVHKTRIEKTSKQGELLTEDQKNILLYMQNIIRLYELKPQSIITYDRLAFFEKENPDLRITFDYNILGQKFNKEEKILLTNKIVMEIKTSTGLDQWLLVLLAKHKIYNTSFSKYVRYYKKEKKGKNEFN